MTIPSPATGRRARAATLGAIAVFASAVLAAACLPPASRGATAPSSVGIGSAGPTAMLSPGHTGPTPRPSFVPPTPTPAPTFAVHTVAAGDNLNSIAKTFGTSPRSIAYWNRTTYPSLDPESPDYAPNLLKLGWTLFLIPNVILTDDEAPPLPTIGAPDASPSG